MPRHYIKPLLHSPPEVQDMIFREVLLLDLSSLVSPASVNTPLLFAIQSLIKHLFPARKNHYHPQPKFGALLALGLKDYEIIDVLRGVQPEKEHIRYNTVFSLSWKRAAWCLGLGFYDRQLNALDFSIIRGSHSLTDYFISIYGVCESNIVTAIEANHQALAKHLEETALRKGVNLSSWRLEFTHEPVKYQKLIASVEYLPYLHQPTIGTSEYTHISHPIPGINGYMRVTGRIQNFRKLWVNIPSSYLQSTHRPTDSQTTSPGASSRIEFCLS
ncbi:hypothetical protein FOFC_20864 [Fusarium oxysporum]|nr:hypothetical protein FOFC_20864 [Fusarium oxysporum]